MKFRRFLGILFLGVVLSLPMLSGCGVFSACQKAKKKCAEECAEICSKQQSECPSKQQSECASKKKSSCSKKTVSSCSQSSCDIDRLLSY